MQNTESEFGAKCKKADIDKKEDELYNSITKDGSSVDPADDGERHIRPKDGDPIEIEE